MRIDHTLLVATLLALFALSGCDSAGGSDSDKQTFSDAVSFNDYLVDRQDTIFDPLMEFVKNDKYFTDTALGYAQLDKIEAASEGVLEDLDNVEAYEGGEAFLEAAKAQAKFYKGIAENDYREVVQLLAKGEALTKAEMERAQTVEDGIFERATAIDNTFLTRQQEFAQQVNMRLEDQQSSDAAQPDTAQSESVQ